MEVNEKEIWQRIADLRIQMGVSEKQMSRELGKSSSYISAMTKNKSLPSLKTLIEIADYFGISLSEFFELDNPYTVKINKIISELQKCNELELEKIYEILHYINSIKDKK